MSAWKTCGRPVEAVHTVTLIHCHTMLPLPRGLYFVTFSSSVDIAVLLNALIAAPLSPVPAHALSLLPLEAAYRMLRCISGTQRGHPCTPSPCMHASLLYQTRSLEDQLQLQEAANHQHRYRVYWFTLTWPIAITC